MEMYLLVLNFKNGAIKKIPTAYKTGTDILTAILQRRNFNPALTTSIGPNTWMTIDIAGQQHFHFDTTELVYAHLHQISSDETKQLDSNNNFKG